MNDLIRRKDVIQEFTKTCSIEHVNINDVAIFYETIMKIINSIPSVESEHKKGKCTKINCPIQIGYILNDCDIKTCPYRTERQVGKWKNVALFTRECSECGAQFHELEYDNFCPNCGARLEQE